MRNPMGGGNPPGANSEGYLSDKTSSGSESFVLNKSYQGSMHVGRNESATEVGNQPKSSSTATLESRSNKESSI